MLYNVNASVQLQWLGRLQLVGEDYSLLTLHIRSSLRDWALNWPRVRNCGGGDRVITMHGPADVWTVVGLFCASMGIRAVRDTTAMRSYKRLLNSCAPDVRR